MNQLLGPSQVRAVLRSQGMARLDVLEAVVLGTDGSLSVLRRSDEPPGTLSNTRTPGPTP